MKKIDTGIDFLELRVLWKKVGHNNKKKTKQNHFHFDVLYRKQDMIDWSVPGEMGTLL